MTVSKENPVVRFFLHPVVNHYGITTSAALIILYLHIGRLSDQDHIDTQLELENQAKILVLAAGLTVAIAFICKELMAFWGARNHKELTKIFGKTFYVIPDENSKKQISVFSRKKLHQVTNYATFVLHTDVLVLHAELADHFKKTLVVDYAAIVDVRFVKNLRIHKFMGVVDGFEIVLAADACVMCKHSRVNAMFSFCDGHRLRLGFIRPGIFLNIKMNRDKAYALFEQLRDEIIARKNDAQGFVDEKNR